MPRARGFSLVQDGSTALTTALDGSETMHRARAPSVHDSASAGLLAEIEEVARVPSSDSSPSLYSHSDASQLQMHTRNHSRGGSISRAFHTVAAHLPISERSSGLLSFAQRDRTTSDSRHVPPSIQFASPTFSAGPNPFASPAASSIRSGQTSCFREALSSPPTRQISTLSFGAMTSSRPTVGMGRRRMKSTLLQEEPDKPWRKRKDTITALGYWTTCIVAFLGVVASGIRIYFGYKGVPRFERPLCSVLDESFSSLDTNTWTRDVLVDGFSNGEFDMTTDSSNNSYVKNGQLHILPTLTSDVIGAAAVLDGHTFNLTDCTGANYTVCSVVSNASTGAVVPPVMSARLSTKGSASIKYGRVEVRAKIPRGDWIWPSIRMLPTDNVYGAGVMSGEIDIMQARGNSPSYTKQGRNYVRGTLHWGPVSWIDQSFRTYGYWNMRRKSYDQEFHTYALEWTEDWLRTYVDTRLHHTLDLRFNKPFFARGDFTAVITNGSTQIATPNPWSANATAPNVAPFDQRFHLELDVSVGGTNGWFPDGAGGKPWIDDSKNAKRDFAAAQNTWYATWPSGDSIDDRAMVIDSVKMWSYCS